MPRSQLPKSLARKRDAIAFDQVVRRLMRLAPDPKTRAWLRAILRGERGAGQVSDPWNDDRLGTEKESGRRGLAGAAVRMGTRG
jgi:hypothetical protein